MWKFDHLFIIWINTSQDTKKLNYKSTSQRSSGASILQGSCCHPLQKHLWLCLGGRVEGGFGDKGSLTFAWGEELEEGVRV